jgi:beta-lactamase regulating signal transducer with metallopeptidase domain
MNSQALLLYVLKSFFISGIFVGYYWLALRNKNFNYYNRFYLLLSMACSVFIPLFNFNWFTIEKQDLPVSNETLHFISTQITSTKSTSFSWQEIVLYVSVSISLLLLILFAINISKVYQLKKRSAIVKMDGVDFVYTNLDDAPFSFLNNLFWKESISLDEDYGRKIFKHEITHIHQKHTLDILFCQVINAILWMNPFNWLIQKELKAIHEFIADKEAVGNNNVEEFVTLLLQAHYGKHFLKPTHSFYYSSIKRRLLMLTTTNKATFSRVRKLLVLPVTLLVMVTMSISTIESKANTMIAPAITVVPAPVASLPTSNTPVIKRQPAKPVHKNDTIPAATRAKEQAEKIKAEADFKGEKITITADSIIITNKGKGKKILENVLYYINNKLATYEEVSKLNPGDIKSIAVWKGDEAIKKYGQAGTDGVIEIITKLVL